VKATLNCVRVCLQSEFVCLQIDPSINTSANMKSASLTVHARVKLCLFLAVDAAFVVGVRAAADAVVVLLEHDDAFALFAEQSCRRQRGDARSDDDGVEFVGNLIG
jgi:hypothetical protein